MAIEPCRFNPSHGEKHSPWYTRWPTLRESGSCAVTEAEMLGLVQLPFAGKFSVRSLPGPARFGLMPHFRAVSACTDTARNREKQPLWRNPRDKAWSTDRCAMERRHLTHKRKSNASAP